MGVGTYARTHLRVGINLQAWSSQGVSWAREVLLSSSERNLLRKCGCIPLVPYSTRLAASERVRGGLRRRAGLFVRTEHHRAAV